MRSQSHANHWFDALNNACAAGHHCGVRLVDEVKPEMPKPPKQAAPQRLRADVSPWIWRHKLFVRSNDIQPLTIDLGRDRITGQQSVSLRFNGSTHALTDHFMPSNDINVATPAGGRCLVAVAEQAPIYSSNIPKVERVELSLGSSRYDHLPLRIAMDYRYLLTALRLGFREIRFGGEASPAWCVDGDRRFVWAVLHPSHVQQASPHAVVISTRRDLVAA